MGYLGLTDKTEKEENLFQRLFWPSDEAGSVDTLGQQGFWICAFVAIMSFLVLLLQGHWIIALLSLLFYSLGGAGVREHSVAAATLVAFAYVLNICASVVAGVFFPNISGILTIIAAMLLLANIRGTWLAARSMKRGHSDAFPERMRQTWRDQLVDQMPAKVWPRGQIAFYCGAVLYIGLAVLGTVALAKRHTAQRLDSPQAEKTVIVSAPDR